MKSTLSTLTVLSLLVAACGGDKPEAKAPVTTQAAVPAPAPTGSSDAAKPMTMTLGETPSDKLGTAPSGLGLKVGDKAPNATLPDVGGKPQKLSDLYAQGPTFVLFYRGGWCPFCNIQLHDLGAAKADFDQRGVKVVAISVDTPNEEAKTQGKQGTKFPMLSDSKLEAHKAFKIVHAAPEAEQKALTGYGIDLKAFSGEDHKSFATPAIFLVDKSGTVKWVHVDEDYKTRPSPKQLLAALDKALTK
jgi:peroxiredoxin